MQAFTQLFALLGPGPPSHILVWVMNDRKAPHADRSLTVLRLGMCESYRQTHPSCSSREEASFSLDRGASRPSGGYRRRRERSSATAGRRLVSAAS